MEKLLRSDIETILKEIELILNEGYSGMQVLNTYFKAILENKQLSRMAKSQILEKIADVERGLMEGGRDDLQLFDLFATSKVIIQTAAN
jgi:DNA polymerase III delta prime subunit